MAWKLEDGRGTRGKSSVFANRLRTFDVENSLTNHLSVESGNLSSKDILNGEVIGTFTARNNITTTLSPGQKAVILSLTNNDPINLMVIDRIFVQLISSGVSVPDTRILVAIDNLSGIGTLPIINENISSNVVPLVKARDIGAASVVPISNLRVYPILKDMTDLIPPGADSIIINGLPTSTTNTASNNTISVVHFSNGNIQVTFEAFIRFMMINPKNIG